MSLKVYFASVFREIFVPGYKSLEFRAKIFTAMLLAKKRQTDDDYKNLEKIVDEIYQNDKKRTQILIATVKEYISKARIYSSLNLDSLLKDIDRDMKISPKYIKKIDFSYLRRLISDDEDDALVQQRVYEFLVAQVKKYSQI